MEPSLNIGVRGTDKMNYVEGGGERPWTEFTRVLIIQILFKTDFHISDPIYFDKVVESNLNYSYTQINKSHQPET